MNSDNNTNNILTQTLAQLQNQLRDIHAQLGAASTQNVRNIVPAHVTIVKCLPTRRCDAITAKELYKRFLAQGGLVKHTTFEQCLAKLVSGMKVDATRFDNVPYTHYYFAAY